MVEARTGYQFGWDFDGNTDAPGQLNDYMMCRQYRRFMLAHTGTPMAGSQR